MFFYISFMFVFELLFPMFLCFQGSVLGTKAGEAEMVSACCIMMSGTKVRCGMKFQLSPSPSPSLSFNHRVRDKARSSVVSFRRERRDSSQLDWPYNFSLIRRNSACKVTITCRRMQPNHDRTQSTLTLSLSPSHN